MKATIFRAHVVWAAREEFAQNIEDVLARRVRTSFLDARAALKIAPKVASVLAAELERTNLGAGADSRL